MSAACCFAWSSAPCRTRFSACATSRSLGTFGRSRGAVGVGARKNRSTIRAHTSTFERTRTGQLSCRGEGAKWNKQRKAPGEKKMDPSYMQQWIVMFSRVVLSLRQTVDTGTASAKNQRRDPSLPLGVHLVKLALECFHPGLQVPCSPTEARASTQASQGAQRDGEWISSDSSRGRTQEAGPAGVS